MSRIAIFRPHCKICRKSLGEMTEDEFNFLMGPDCPDALCFDCDSSSGLTVPGFMVPAYVGNRMVIDGLEFWVNRNANFDLRWRCQTKGPELRVASYSLSSSTYLNILPKTDNQDTVFFDALQQVPGSEQLQDLALHFSSNREDCEKIRSLPDRDLVGDAILAKSPPFTPCPDCEKIRGLPFRDTGNASGWYCEYHRALLVEQWEDGSLGYGHEQ